MLINAYNNFDELINSYMKCYEASFKGEEYKAKIEEADKAIEKINAKKDKLLELNLEGNISNAEFAVRNKRFNDEIKDIEIRKREYLSRQNSSGLKTSDIVSVRNTIKTYLINGNLELTRVSVDKMIDRIYVSYINEKETEITIILRTNQKTTCRVSPKSRENGVLRHVNTFKKMIEAQEKKMAGETPDE